MKVLLMSQALPYLPAAGPQVKTWQALQKLDGSDGALGPWKETAA